MPNKLQISSAQPPEGYSVSMFFIAHIKMQSGWAILQRRQDTHSLNPQAKGLSRQFYKRSYLWSFFLYKRINVGFMQVAAWSAGPLFLHSTLLDDLQILPMLRGASALHQRIHMPSADRPQRHSVGYATEGGIAWISCTVMPRPYPARS